MTLLQWWQCTSHEILNMTTMMTEMMMMMMKWQWWTTRFSTDTVLGVPSGTFVFLVSQLWTRYGRLVVPFTTGCLTLMALTNIGRRGCLVSGKENLVTMLPVTSADLLHLQSRGCILLLPVEDIWPFQPRLQPWCQRYGIVSISSLRYTLKEGSVNKPTEYLGNQVGRCDMHDPLNPGRQCWAMSSDLYVKHAVGEVEKELGEIHQQLRLPSKVSMPLSAGYRPEVDGTKLLRARQAVILNCRILP